MNHNFLLSTDDIMNNDATRPKKYLKLEKVDIDFEIPSYDKYHDLLRKNYRTTFLKIICKHYKLKISGSKPVLVDRIYNYLMKSYFTIKIQKMWRKCFIQKFNKLFGPAQYNRSICSNDTDFFTLDDINKIPYYNFISYEAPDKTIWGFELLSLYNLFVKGNDIVLNPYTREKMEYNILNRLTKIIKFSKILKIKLDLTLDDNIDLISSKKQLELRSLELFQYIDELGNYTDVKWFTSLKRWELVKFIRELVDIWEYRSQLTDEMKKEICYPSGNPFHNINVNFISSLHINVLQKEALKIIYELIKTGINRDNQVLGASYVLCGLTLVNNDAALALPWFYQSVNHN